MKFVRQIKGTEDPKLVWELFCLTFQIHFYLFLKSFSVIPIINQLTLWSWEHETFATNLNSINGVGKQQLTYTASTSEHADSDVQHNPVS